MSPEVNAIARADMHAQLADAFADRFAVTEVARFDLSQTNTDSRLCNLVANDIKPIRERFVAIGLLVTDEINHGIIVT